MGGIIMAEEKQKTYEEGVQVGYNYAVNKILEALEIKLVDEPGEEEEFLNKP
jgi:hypothetical protein